MCLIWCTCQSDLDLRVLKHTDIRVYTSSTYTYENHTYIEVQNGMLSQPYIHAIYTVYAVRLLYTYYIRTNII